MLTNEDINLSKISYTDKDFGTLYPDLLDLAKDLTNQWDPASSNESDPGVVLLKEAAFVGDHNNYNIDKNVLENFLPSATQLESVQNIVEMNGYNPRYYVSGYGSINFSYQLTDEDYTEGQSNFQRFTLPRFTLVIKSDSGIVYTQASSLSVSKENLNTSCDFIQGTVNDLEISGSKTILLENLDQNNRVYFNTPYVASNGIYINNKGNEVSDWQKVNYLQTIQPKTKAYKLGYDSVKELPYIEFPADIASIIGSGITIKYIVTDGINGNVGFDTLKTIVSPTEYKVSDDFTVKAEKFSISNTAPIVNGKNPETIDEMYKSFLKVVGTFDTLVTCRDYSNYINSIVDDNTQLPLVSNSVVTDITNDYNNSITAITYDEYGEYFKTLPLTSSLYQFKLKTSAPQTPEAGDIYPVIVGGQITGFKLHLENGTDVSIDKLSYTEFQSATETMSYYDLCIYALKQFSIAQYTSKNKALALKNSFMPIDNNTKEAIKTKISSAKCISHNFKDTKTGDIICFKNYVPLNVVITPYAKVTKSERDEIINNITRKLSEDFNSSKVYFGEELNYDSVYDSILNADDRIKNISLSDFSYEPYVMVEDTNNTVREIPLYGNTTESNELLITLVAKNILAGRVCLFSFDEDFKYHYGEQQVTEYLDISSLKTNLKINLEDGEGSTKVLDNYSVSDNENILVTYPNYYSDAIYPVYVNYRYTSDTTDPIQSNTDHTLVGQEKLILMFTSGETERTVTYQAGDTIKTNFLLEPFDNNVVGITKTLNGQTAVFKQLTAQQQIAHRVLLKTVLDSVSTPCYWITNRVGNTLFNIDTTAVGPQTATTILESGEYFIYSNATKDTLIIIGPGTKLEYIYDTTSGTYYNSQQWSIPDPQSIPDPTKTGISANINWNIMDFSVNNLSIIEMNVLTLTQDDNVSLDGGTLDTGDTLDNTWKEYDGSITYTISGEQDPVTLPKGVQPYLIKTRLDVNTTNLKQKLIYTADKEQSITLTVDGTDTEIKPTSQAPEIYFGSNDDLNLIGGNSINLSEYLKSFDENLKLNIKSFYTTPIIYHETTSGEDKQINSENGHYTVPLTKAGTIQIPVHFKKEFSTLGSKNCIIPIWFQLFGGSSSDVTVSITDTDGDPVDVLLRDFDNLGESSSFEHFEKDGMYLLRLFSVTQFQQDIDILINLSVSGDNNPEIAVIYEPVVYTGLNKNIKLDNIPNAFIEVLNKIRELISRSTNPELKPYYIYNPANDLALQSEDFSVGDILWDKNNIANKITIPEIVLDLDTESDLSSSFEISKSMRDYR